MKLLLQLSIALCFFTINAQTYIPDDAFEQKLIDWGWDSTGVLDDYVPTADIDWREVLNFGSVQVADFTGIEDFAALKTINIGNAATLGIDVSQNTALENFSLSYAPNVTSLDLSGLSNLVEVFVEGNAALSTFSVTGCTSLERLWLTNDPLLTSVELSTNTSMLLFESTNSGLTSLDFTNCTSLLTVKSNNNQLNSLVTGAAPITSLRCANNLLTVLDISLNSDLQYLECNNNSLTNLDITTNLNLTNLNTSNNQLTTLLTGVIGINYLNAQNNFITDLDVSQNTELISVLLTNNDLQNFTIKNGNNTAINTSNFNTIGNLNLVCIDVDNEPYSTTNWTNIDAQTSFSEDCALGTNNLVLDSIVIYPNPTSEILKVSVSDAGIVFYSILDMQGRIITSEIFSATSEISVAHLKNGMYFLQLSNSEKNTITQKFIKN